MTAQNAEWPDERWQHCLRLKRQGVEIPALAAALGVSRSALLGKLWRKGISAKAGVEFLPASPTAEVPRPQPAGKTTLPTLPSLVDWT